jgi:hypothetical protein
MPNGKHLVQVLSCGFMESVSILYPYSHLKLMVTAFAAGSGKSVIWCDNLNILYSQAYALG